MKSEALYMRVTPQDKKNLKEVQERYGLSQSNAVAYALHRLTLNREVNSQNKEK